MYQYDTASNYGLGRLHEATTDAGSTTYDYDHDGRTSTYKFHSNSSNLDYTFGYQYNPGGLLKRIKFPDAEAYLYTYHPDGTEYSLKRESDNYDVASILFYNAFRQPYKIVAQSGLEYTRMYDGFGKIKQIMSEHNGAQSTTIMDLLYSYYPSERIQARGDEGLLMHLDEYLYDDAGRLSKWLLDGVNAEEYDFLVGTSVSSKLQGVHGSQTAVDFGFTNTVFPWAVTKVSNNSSGLATIYQYDLDGRLSRSYTNPSFPTKYTYGALGLLRQVSTPVVGAPIKSWKYDHGDNPVHINKRYSWPVVKDFGVDLVGANYENHYTEGRRTKHFFFGGQRLASFDSTGAKRYYHSDERGSVRYVTDENGTILEQNRYKPYGQEYSTSGSSDFLKYRFNDRRDEEYGLLRFPLRNLGKNTYHWTAFDPLARFSPDSLLGDGGNSFAYCGYDPINNVDLLGGARIPIIRPIPLPSTTPDINSTACGFSERCSTGPDLSDGNRDPAQPSVDKSGSSDDDDSSSGNGGSSLFDPPEGPVVYTDVACGPLVGSPWLTRPLPPVLGKGDFYLRPRHLRFNWGKGKAPKPHIREYRQPKVAQPKRVPGLPPNVTEVPPANPWWHFFLRFFGENLSGGKSGLPPAVPGSIPWGLSGLPDPVTGEVPEVLVH